MFNHLWRLIRINIILMRYNIADILLPREHFYFSRCFIYLNPYLWRKQPLLTRAERVRRALEDLGPIFVKMGQIISTRSDVIPDDIAFELTKLQDRVPPFAGEIAKDIIEKALRAPLASLFADFDSRALASASIAQVHAATLLSGEAVVIKVLRPNIQKIIQRDIALLLTLAKWLERCSTTVRHFKPQQLVHEVAQTLMDELDLLREGANATQLRRNFKHSPMLYVPKIYWLYSCSHVLTMERIHGVPIHDITRLRQANVDMQKLAERGIEIFFTQIFRDSFFHADLHPGNLFVDIKDPTNPTYIAVDFGIVGSLSQNDQRYLAENMLAFFKRDYQRVAELHIACGWLPPDTRIDLFEGAIRSVSEPIFELPLRQISFGHLLFRLFQVARRFNINIQPQLILLQKTLVSIEGLTRQIAPDLDLWGKASPEIERWLKKQVGVRAFAKRLRENLPLWSEQLPALPTLLYEVLLEKKQQQARLRFAEKAPAASKHTIAKMKLRYFLWGVACTLLSVTVTSFILLNTVHSVLKQ